MQKRIQRWSVAQAKARTNLSRVSTVRNILGIILPSTVPIVAQQLERHFEDQIIVPLLTQWKLPYRRQVRCRLRSRTGMSIGRIDFLVHTEDNAKLLTLIENKRGIRNGIERERAVAQANSYARARRMRTFVIAAPEGLWIYSRPGGKPALQAAFTAGQLRDGAPEAKALLIRLNRRGHY